METVQSPAEQRVVLHNVSWDTYERLLVEREESRVPRFTYDRGVLEITSPSTQHESVGYYVGLLVAVFAGERGLGMYGAGSTTYKRKDLERGFEPDASFYIQNTERVRGKPRIDLEDLDVDPPPDLVVEVDISHPSLDKLPIYARLRVPEVWRYQAGRVVIFDLRGEEYVEVAESSVLPPLTSEALSDLIKESASLGIADWMRRVRERAREHGTNR